MKWFRLWDEMIDDPKIHELTDSEFRVFMYLMCLANRQVNRGGIPLDLAQTSRILRLHINKVTPAVETLQRLRIIKYNPDNSQILFINWGKRQFKSDDIGARVKRYRDKERNVTVTPRARADTDIDTDTEKEVAFSFPNKEEVSESSLKKIKADLTEVCTQLKPIWPDVFKFKNRKLKEGKNPRAVLHALCRCYLKQEFDENGPWGYCVNILKAEDGNFNEREHRKTS